MKVTLSHIILPWVSIAAGALLIYAGLGARWGLTWAMAGGFFITIGIAANLLNLAWTLRGPFGDMLRSLPVNIVLLLAVLGMLVATVVTAIIRGGH